MSHQLKVLGPDTIAMGAATLFDVIPLIAFWGSAHKEVMGQSSAAIKAKLAVAVMDMAAEPDSTTVSPARVYFGPEPFFGSAADILGTHRENPPSVVMGQDVDASLPSYFTRCEAA